MRVIRYVRDHHIGLIALFIALTGTAYAGTQMASISSHSPAAKAKKKKKVKRGPAGPQGPKGDAGPAGSPAPSINTGVIATSASCNCFGAASGVSNEADNELDVQTLAPASASFTARDLSMSLDDNESLPGGKIASLTLRVGGADTALSCAIPAGGRSCQDTTHAVTVPPNSRLSMRVLFSGVGTFGPERWAFGWRAVP
jgi:hypothetical protein